MRSEKEIIDLCTDLSKEVPRSSYTIAQLNILEWVLADDKEAVVCLMLDEVRVEIKTMISELSEIYRYNDSGNLVSKLKKLQTKIEKLNEHFT